MQSESRIESDPSLGFYFDLSTIEALTHNWLKQRACRKRV